MKYKAKVSIIILNWNGKNDTLECLESVKKIDYSNFEVIVVDNGSDDDSSVEIRKQFPDITVIETGKNLGFAEGNNVGIRHALRNGAEYIFLLNNDAVADQQILNAFLEAAQLYPDAGIFGAKIYYYSEPDKIQFAVAKWVRETCYFDHIGEGEVDNEDKFEAYRETDFVMGCAFYFRKELIDKVGYLEPRFFLNYEETDWCFRARYSGYKCFFVPKAKVWHKGSVSLGGQASPQYSYFMTRNELFWAERNLRFNERLNLYKRLFNELSPYFYMGNYRRDGFARCFYWATAKYLSDFKKNLSNKNYIARIYGIRDYILRRFGNCPNRVRNMKKIKNIHYE